ncbi:sensor histidine kinase [Oceanihabitans sediminis]|uniref:histidine kinase n=2 Tax=Pseudomonadati TaxID=3379134 RepID=A0A368P5E5_9FLAO|nr:HAMP domain-containing sensor histidine kinase [Oceanihabitans sediminis]MDX1278475.1 HAMP domain-containing sensor histidine kinase [Oceanihabitans sediminis]RBP32982.1 phospho-acceptor domain-containing protein [Oceanihabitans sediminis]RCU57500.1 sensor histidine kinase [Oceanihabitans sediminis]
MKALISAEEKLKERIKELKCLYAVSSFIANSNLENLSPTIQVIANSLQKAVRYPEDASVEILLNKEIFREGEEPVNKVFLLSAIKAFNIPIGSIKVGYSEDKYTSNDFLNEEKRLIQKVASEIGNLFERKQIIEKELMAKRQMERVDRLSILGEITAGIAHELNTPLANILGYSELLKDQFADNKDATSDLEKITNSAIYSREVVKKLMFFSCEMPHQMKQTNIVPIIKDAISLLKPNFISKHIDCKVQILEEDIPYRVDSIQLTQVIFNLIINAIHFSPENGTITVNVRQNIKNIIIEISDEGEGIDVSKSENIFNPFFTTKQVGEGSGLGLSVVHGIVKSHKGTIEHSPNTPKGTTFTIKFPKK